MKINKEIRQLSRNLLRASFTDGQLDRGKIASLVQSLIDKKPRHYVDVLENYKRLIRLEAEKRHARIESASELNSDTRAKVLTNLSKKYGKDLSTEFVVKRLAQRIHHAAEQSFSDRHLEKFAGGLGFVAFLDFCVVPEQDRAHFGLFKIEGEPVDAVREFNHLVEHDVAQSFDARHAVAGFAHHTDIAFHCRCF